MPTTNSEATLPDLFRPANWTRPGYRNHLENL